MLIVGGTYRERTLRPATDYLWGSGLKAAACAAHLGRGVRLVTCAHKSELAEIEASAAQFGFGVDVTPRSAPIAFDYFTPISRPETIGLQQGRVALRARASVALVFGMLEATADVQADHLVFDPQSPSGPVFPPGLRDSSKHLALLLNQHELLALYPGLSVPNAARRLGARHSASVVAVKCGALGALVHTERGRDAWIPAHPSATPWPIGTGDVFSALFAWFWGKRQLDAQRAASLASAGTAVWSSSFPPRLPRSPNALLRAAGRPLRKSVPPRVYLAGPFFSVQDQWLVDIVRAALLDLGAKVFSPLHDVGLGQDEVARKDIAALKRCNAVLALLDNLDSGTVFEVGYAVATGKPVVGYSTYPDSSALRMIRGSGIPVCHDLALATYQTIWAGA